MKPKYTQKKGNRELISYFPVGSGSQSSWLMMTRLSDFVSINDSWLILGHELVCDLSKISVRVVWPYTRKRFSIMAWG